MRITIRFFAILKDRAGVSEASLELPVGASVASATQSIGEKFPSLCADLERAAFAINRAYVKADSTLNEGDELALIPPVSGG